MLRGGYVGYAVHRNIFSEDPDTQFLGSGVEWKVVKLASYASATFEANELFFA